MTETRLDRSPERAIGFRSVTDVEVTAANPDLAAASFDVDFGGTLPIAEA